MHLETRKVEALVKTCKIAKQNYLTMCVCVCVYVAVVLCGGFFFKSLSLGSIHMIKKDLSSKVPYKLSQHYYSGLCM